jgi:signal transduction histidine kinase
VEPEFIHKLDLRTENDVVKARRNAREIAARLGFEVQDQTRIATACSEIARNAVRYAGGGQMMFALDGSVSPALMIVVDDKGPGIEDTRRILTGRYQSSTGMGLGIIGAKRLMDGFNLDTAKGRGTKVTLRKLLPAKRAPQKIALDKISAGLTSSTDHDLIHEVEEQNRELMSTLDQLRERQAELERLNRELDDTNRGVVALYAELDERAGFLQRSSELKSRFLSNMSHEFRTPLNSILSLCQLLLQRVDGELTDEQERQITYVKSSAASLLDLVNDLLDLAKIEAGKISVRAEEFEIPALFGALRGMLRPLITDSSSVVLTFQDASDLPALVSDESKVSQILRNFISNALKFTERGEVHVSAARGLHDTIVFAVRDTGIGIAATDQARIFEEFTQVDSILQRKAKGTGLGLPLTRKLAELLGGSVSLQSEPGVGSTFTLVVPRVYAVIEQELSLSIGRGERVLIVDDEEVSRYLLKGLLPPGCEILEADNGRTGLKLAQERIPTVIFLDLVMPDFDGFDFLRDIKGDAATSGIPVVIHTSKVLDPEESSRLLRDAVDIVPKESPSREVSIERVRNALRKAGVSAAMESR